MGRATNTLSEAAHYWSLACTLRGYKQIKSTTLAHEFSLSLHSRPFTVWDVRVLYCAQYFGKVEDGIQLLNICIWTDVELDSKSGMYIVRRMLQCLIKSDCVQ